MGAGCLALPHSWLETVLAAGGRVSPAGLPGISQCGRGRFSAAREGKPSCIAKAASGIRLPVYHYPVQATQAEGNVAGCSTLPSLTVLVHNTESSTGKGPAMRLFL